MIHDLLLSCLNFNAKQLPVAEFIECDAVSMFLHPCEKKILLDIIEIINLLRDIAKFTKVYGSSHKQALQANLLDTDEPLQGGLYLKAFANGIDNVLDDYYKEITELERRYLQNPTQSLLFIYQKLQVYEPVGLFLRKLIRGIRTQKLHGCAIIQFLHQNTQHGDARICRAIKTIIASVNVVFLNQLTHWILYAKLIDNFGEFFIQSVETPNSIFESDKATSSGSGRQTNTTVSDVGSTYTDIWRYEICQQFLPHYFTSSWSEKVLFIGQTVLIFKVDTTKDNKATQVWHKSEANDVIDGEQTLWNDREPIYFGKLQALQHSDALNISHYERVIDDIKSYVTARLSELAVNQADLVQQLRLIKDFYLLGRGELFLEFIRRTCVAGQQLEHAQRLRDYVKAFESAAHGVGVSEELEKFSLSLQKPSGSESAENQSGNSASNTNLEAFGEFAYLQLHYKINWPLHLLFSPRVIERYNLLFRFLLLIKRLQFQLHMIWCMQTRHAKTITHEQQTENAHRINNKVMALRNQLMFFVDNLQYYIQVDVLESQFSILLNTVLNKADFEQIQRAHSVFQANILSLCFLLNDDDVARESISQSNLIHTQNPVYFVINDIFHLCEDFNASFELSADEQDKRMNELDLSFNKLMQKLMNLLSVLKITPSSTTPLSQLLLRLDFNHWFSDRIIDLD